MSIFGSIVSKIFGHAEASPAPATPPAAGSGAPPAGGSAPASFNNPASTSTAPGSTASSAPGSSTGSSTTTGSSTPTGTGTSPSGSASSHVDVTSILDGLAAKNSQKLDWRHSIVDLMKLLDLDSSLHARQELAKELHYSGSMDDSASMNIWLHKQVMQKLADNGGKVPDDLK